MAGRIDTKHYAAVDIGASSGRVLMGWVEDGKMAYEEVYRFDNAQVLRDGHSCWDIEGLYEHVVRGLAAAREKTGIVPQSIAIDTWGVDFVLLDENDQMIGDAVAYRDGRTDGIFEVADKIMDPAELYARTGIQRQPFNTAYQLLALKCEHPEQLEAARTFLMVPDYLVWRLTGAKTNEYTNASTTGLLDARACTWDQGVLDAFGIPASIFLAPTMPGAVAGGLLPEVAKAVGYDAPVVLCASHDTGSAYLSVPARDEHAAYLSSGTWSLLGCELPEPVCGEAAREQNFTNEGGYQRRYRFLKNIMGLWMNQSVRREVNGVDYVEGKTANKAMLDHQIGFGELIQMTQDAEPFAAYVDVDDERFLAPDSMFEEIRSACADAGQIVPETIGEVMRTVYCSLTSSYARAVAGLAELTDRDYTSLNIVGGGCQDNYLNQMTADACGIPVFAGPIEGTCIGNFVVQMIRDGVFADLADARACIARSFDIRRFDPQH
ncbi:rhamnulokinase family protein [Paratractidigestivibacter sp.]|uniref:rhamnulokinase n=1 Tax=Paratractidigestivibacter sp. TaxID=2847316 RepID=UPI002AC8BEBE|nr:rhamnulokinase family protein [Paratractidigestivibacter sp.]